MRERTKVNVAPTETVGETTNLGEPYSSGSFLTAFDYESMKDVVTPGFASRVSKGESIFNPCSYRRESRSISGTGSARYVSTLSPPSFDYEFRGPLTTRTMLSYDPFVSLDSLDEEGLRERAILSAIAGIDSTPLSTGEDLLEIGETIRFLKNPLRGILTSSESLFKLKKRSRITNLVGDIWYKDDWLDVPANAWATYRFAFSPFVKSLHDILSSLKTPPPKPPELRTSHGRASDEASSSGDPSFGPTSERFTFSVAKNETVSYHAAIRYRVSNPVYDFRWKYGLRNKDIIPTFWAVMPLSFMVDRLYDVSSFVQAAQNLVDPSVQILGATITRKYNLSRTARVTSASSTNSDVSYSGSGETVILHSTSYDRGLFNPSISDTIPRVTPKELVKDLTNITDLLALLRLRTR